ncbi:hypothetical protein LTR86_008571 [Recurvomyces mirabilis]|nr:hypothetical protein LTR86_008571 [Recurvomyces mirabilis]
MSSAAPSSTVAASSSTAPTSSVVSSAAPMSTTAASSSAVKSTYCGLVDIERNHELILEHYPFGHIHSQPSRQHNSNKHSDSIAYHFKCIDSGHIKLAFIIKSQAFSNWEFAKRRQQQQWRRQSL